MFRGYNVLLTKYPLPTKMVTSGFLFGVGDVVCQLIEQKDKKSIRIDKARLGKFSFFGCFLGAPILSFHYGRVLQWITPKTTPLATLAKVSFDQLVFAPFFLTYIFIVMPMIEGKQFSEAKQGVNEKLWPALCK